MLNGDAFLLAFCLSVLMHLKSHILRTDFEQLVKLFERMDTKDDSKSAALPTIEKLIKTAYQPKLYR